MCEIAQFYRQIHDFGKPDQRVKLAPGQFIKMGNRCSVELHVARVIWGFLPQVKIRVNGNLHSFRILQEGEVLDLSKYGCNWLCVPRASVASSVGAEPDYFLLDMHQVFTPRIHGTGKDKSKGNSKGEKK